jgi:hypothetical protein
MRAQDIRVQDIGGILFPHKGPGVRARGSLRDPDRRRPAARAGAGGDPPPPGRGGGGAPPPAAPGPGGESTRRSGPTRGAGATREK